MVDIEDYASKLASGLISGADLAQLLASGVLDKSQRRRITKRAAKLSTQGTAKQVSKIPPPDSKGKVVHVPVQEGDSTANNSKKRKLDTKDDEAIKRGRSSPRGDAHEPDASSQGLPSSDDEGSRDGSHGDVEQPTGALAPRQLKMKLKLLNKELAGYSSRKQLTEARKRFNGGLRRGLQPDVHTFSNLINCYVRCGDTLGAMQVLQNEMPQHGVRANAVVYTAVLKGLCEAASMPAAEEMLQTSILNTVQCDDPSYSRALMTYLRGCIRIGDVSRALRLQNNLNNVADFKDNTNAGPSRPWSLAAQMRITALLCQALRVDEAEDRVSDINAAILAEGGSVDDPAGFNLDLATTMVRLAQAHAVLGRPIPASQWARQATTLLQRGQQSNLLQAMRGHINSVVSTGSGNSSTELFRKHQREELAVDLHRVDSYVREGMAHGGTKGPVGQLQRHYSQSRKQGVVADAAAAPLIHQLGRFLVLGVDGRANCPTDTAAQEGSTPHILSAKELGLAMVKSVRERHGLASPALAGTALEPLVRAAESKLRSVLDESTGRLNYTSLFLPLSVDSAPDALSKLSASMPAISMKSTSCDPSKLPVKLELCCGNGDWIVEQARADLGRAFWIGAELRSDRTHAALTRAVLLGPRLHEDLQNLALVSGDAVSLLRDRIPFDSVSAIFINHPEPPERAMQADRSKKKHVAKASTVGQSRAQGSHLLTPDFLKLCLKVLKPGIEQTSGGTLAIATDSLPYAKLLAESLAHLSNPQEGRSHCFRDVTEDLEQLREDNVYCVDTRIPSNSGKSGKVSVWKGDIADTDVGVTNASSYFDRMWSAGNNKKRWYILVQKGFVDSSVNGFK
eukprot:GSChrysophyteH1.ASY1.ANO1.2795.1 assembled CDS